MKQPKASLDKYQKYNLCRVAEEGNAKRSEKVIKKKNEKNNGFELLFFSRGEGASLSEFYVNEYLFGCLLVEVWRCGWPVCPCGGDAARNSLVRLKRMTERGVRRCET